MATTPEGDDVTADNKSVPAASNIKSKPKKGFFSRIWNFLFRGGKEDFEKRLENLSKEEAVVIARLKRRSKQWQRLARSIIIYAIFLEGIAMAFAFMTTRNQELEWQMRALRVLPVFGLPAVAGCLFYSCSRLFKRFERNDQKTLEKLQAEKHANLDELKERNNFYTMLQQIQRYDPDPALRDAAARVLASKIGAETGLNVTLKSDSGAVDSLGKTHDADLAQSSGLRNRKQSHERSADVQNRHLIENTNTSMAHNNAQDEMMTEAQIVEHHQQGKAGEGGWMSRIAAMLVGEDPSQCYALICGNCHRHNGLARKEDFPYIKYYCPHCGIINCSKDLSTIDKAVLSKTENPAIEEKTLVEKAAVSSHDKGAGSPESIDTMANDITKVTEKPVEADTHEVTGK